MTGEDVQRIRDEVMALARDAHAEMEHAKGVFSSPYSGQEWLTKYHEARGYWRGLWKASEVIDALSPEVVSGRTQHEAQS